MKNLSRSSRVTRASGQCQHTGVTRGLGLQEFLRKENPYVRKMVGFQISVQCEGEEQKFAYQMQERKPIPHASPSNRWLTRAMECPVDKIRNSAEISTSNARHINVPKEIRTYQDNQEVFIPGIQFPGSSDPRRDLSTIYLL